MTKTAWVEPEATPLLNLLGTLSDPKTERGVECPGFLPAASDPNLVERAMSAKKALGSDVFVLGHHYQRDEVIQFADVTGDSFRLAREAAARPEAKYIVFLGVHFMAESADILTSPEQAVVLPDLAAGCSMADMATAHQVEDAWAHLDSIGLTSSTVPVVYMNSSAAIKSFTGQHGGTVCTSSNAKRAIEWALTRGERVLFLPDQHLGRNTATNISDATPPSRNLVCHKVTVFFTTHTSQVAALLTLKLRKQRWSSGRAIVRFMRVSQKHVWTRCAQKSQT